MTARLIGSAWTVALVLLAGTCTHRRPHELALARSGTVFADGGPIAVGSALLLPGGRALTCLHVVRGARQQLILRHHDSEYRAVIVVRNEPTDLALLSLQDGPSVPPTRWVERGRVEVGDTVFAVGAPYGLAASLLWGRVSHTDRTGADGAFSRIPFIQTQGLSYPGTSGAAVYLPDGSAIGINRATFGFAPGTSIGFTVPAELIRSFLKSAGAE